jgi:hypothetical protein
MHDAISDRCSTLLVKVGKGEAQNYISVVCL